MIIYTRTANLVEVLTALGSAKEGDTIQLPPGASATWKSQLITKTTLALKGEKTVLLNPTGKRLIVGPVTITGITVRRI